MAIFSRVTRYPIPVPLRRASTKSTLLWIVGTFTISTRPTGTPRGARAFFGQRALLFLRPPPRDGAGEWVLIDGLGIMQMDTDHNSQGRDVRLVVSQFGPSSALVLSANRANRDVIFCWRYPVSLQAYVPNP